MTFPKSWNIFVIFILCTSYNFLDVLSQPVTESSNQSNTTDGKSNDEKVTIYTSDNFLGIPWTLTVSNCSDVPPLLYKKTSSIDTHNNCVVLYSLQNCTGKFVQIAPGTSGHSHLSSVNFDDTLASLKLCQDEPKSSTTGAINPPTTKHKTESVPKRVKRSIIEIPEFLQTLIGNFNSENPTSSSTSTSNEDQDDDEQQDSRFGGLFRQLSFSNMLNGFQDNSNNSDE